MKHCHGNDFNILRIQESNREFGKLEHTILRNDYVYQFRALFIYLIPADVLPGNSTTIGIIDTL